MWFKLFTLLRLPGSVVCLLSLGMGVGAASTGEFGALVAIGALVYLGVVSVSCTGVGPARSSWRAGCSRWNTWASCCICLRAELMLSTKAWGVWPKSSMAPTKCGAHSELIACAHLLRQGFDVYRAVNWTSKADLVAVRGEEVVRVQVKTGAHLKGKFHYPKPLTDSYDLRIVVDHKGNIVIEKFRADRQAA